MANICAAWHSKIELALKVREELFGQYAKEATNFYDGPANFMWKDTKGFLDKGGMLPTFRIQVNKIFEAVALFGPSLYAQNPNAMVEAILPPEVPPEAFGINPQAVMQGDPESIYAMQWYTEIAQQEAMKHTQRKACAAVKSSYLNWLQQETDKKTESRRMLTEALVAGVGYLETVMHRPPGSNIKFPRSRYLSWNDVVFDPDASYYEDVQWMGIRRYQPVNLADERWGYERGYLKGHYQSYESQPSKTAKKEAHANRDGKSFDLIEYWEVYSKNGFGDLLFDGATNQGADLQKLQAFDYSPLGKFCYIVVAKNVQHPLNVPSEVLLSGDPEELLQRTQWPIPFWNDDGGWPISRLGFYEKPNCIWPISIFKAAIGELRFVNWCLSFLADKVAASCTTYVGILKAAGEDIRKQIENKTGPFTIIEISQTLDMPLDKLISFLQSPNFSMDIWNMLAQVLDLIDKRTGLTELIYGLTGASMRSAAEANIKNANVAVRPDDMASRTEDCLSEVQIREMQAARWHCEPQDVAPAVGQLGAMLWQNYVMTGDVDEVVRGFNYRIEAGSARKPNKANRISQLNEFGQFSLKVFAEMAVAGNVGPWNSYVADWCKANDLDPSGYLLPEPDPNQPDPEQQKVQAEMELKVAELQMDMQKMQAELGFKQAELDMEMRHEERRMMLEEEQHQAEMEQDKEEAKVKLQVTKQVGAAKAKQAAKPKPKPGAKK